MMAGSPAVQPDGLLRAGSVVALRTPGTDSVFRVVPPEFDGRPDAAPPRLELGKPGLGAGALEDPATHLVVATRDGYFGFCSAAAGGRFLQGARRLSGANPKLVFYSRLCGVWEQWDVRRMRGGSRTQVELSPRRLPEAKLVVELVFVPESPI